MTTTEKQQKAASALVGKVFHDVWEALTDFECAADDLGFLPDNGETCEKVRDIILSLKETICSQETSVYKGLYLQEMQGK